jgi:mono/diheme cytochrome c family protein
MKLNSWMFFRLPSASLLALGLAVACVSELAPLPSAADATRVQARFAGSSVASLSEGRSLYLARCGSCHALRDPNSLPADAWAGEVRDMRVSKGVRLSADDAQQITAYLVAVSSR